MRLVVVSLEAWDEVWRRNQHLVDGVLRRDPELEVLFVEPAADPLHALRRRRAPRPGRGLRSADGYDGRLRLLQPTKLLPRVVGPLADRMLAASVRRAVRRLGWGTPVLWLNDPGAVALAVGASGPVLYDITDDWVAARRAPREHARLEHADGLLLRTADEVVVCSRGLLREKAPIRPEGRVPLRLIPNAVDRDAYRTRHPRPADLPDGAVALYAGTLHEDRLDVALVLRSADAARAAGGRVVLVGPDALGDEHRRALREHPGIVVTGARPREAIPGYLQHADVLLVPHLVDPFTESLDPIKLYEYLAAGRPVVSTPVAGFRDDPRVRAVEADAFPAAVREALARPVPTVVHEGVPDWSDRVEEVAAVLRGLATERAERPPAG